MRRVVWVALVGVLALVGVGCEDEEMNDGCYHPEVTTCQCADTRWGEMKCDTRGNWGACLCEGKLEGGSCIRNADCNGDLECRLLMDGTSNEACFHVCNEENLFRCPSGFTCDQGRGVCLESEN